MFIYRVLNYYRCSSLESQVKEVELALRKERERLAREVVRLEEELTGKNSVFCHLVSKLSLLMIRYNDKLQLVYSHSPLIKSRFFFFQVAIRSRES